METKRRKYTKEFKLSVVYELLGGMKPKEVFEKYQLDRQTGYRWLQEFKADGEKAFERKELVPGDELKEAQKRIKELETENRILKKATAYFTELNSK